MSEMEVIPNSTNRQSRKAGLPGGMPMKTASHDVNPAPDDSGQVEAIGLRRSSAYTELTALAYLAATTEWFIHLLAAPRWFAQDSAPTSDADARQDKHAMNTEKAVEALYKPRIRTMRSACTSHRNRFTRRSTLIQPITFGFEMTVALA